MCSISSVYIRRQKHTISLQLPVSIEVLHDENDTTFCFLSTTYCSLNVNHPVGEHTKRRHGRRGYHRSAAVG